MGNCCSCTPATPLAATGEVTSKEQSSTVILRGVGAPKPSPRQCRKKPGRGSPQVKVSLDEQSGVQSTTQKVQFMKDVELPPLPPQRSGAKSSAGPSSRGPSSDHRQASAGECDSDWPKTCPLADNDKGTQGHLPDDQL